MPISYSTVAEKIYNSLKGFGYSVQSFNEDGELVIDPSQGSRFAVDSPNIIVRVNKDKDEVYMATSEDINADEIRIRLKELAQDYLLDFDYKVFDKKLKPKGEQIDIKRNAERDMAEVMEANYGKMTGSTKSSYQALENIKLIVRHKKAVNEEVRGARSRNIHSILIQRGEEKFKMAENNLQAARAMARHLYNGGEVYDQQGTTISKMAEDYRQLREFVRYVKNSKLVNESNQEYVDLAIENINDIRTTFKKLSGVKTYANTIESISDYNNVEILEDDIDLESKFTETHFDNKVSNVMDNLKTLVNKKKSFESKIVSAIESESFATLKDKLQESDLVDFASPHAKLGHQVSQLGYSASDPVLSNYLQSISSKLSSGGDLNQFEYGTIKSCLLSANTNSKNASPVDVAETYEAFLNQFTD